VTNTASKSERAALAGSTTATTLFQQASAQIALEQTGRFSALARERAAKPTIAGDEPFVRYPGAASWTEAAQMPEPPLGFSVEDMVPVGEAHEIEKATPVSSSAGVALGEDVPAEAVPASPSSASPSPAAAAQLAELLPKITRRRLR
jgi:hypothetical protein